MCVAYLACRVTGITRQRNLTAFNIRRGSVVKRDMHDISFYKGKVVLDKGKHSSHQSQHETTIYELCITSLMNLLIFTVAQSCIEHSSWCMYYELVNISIACMNSHAYIDNHGYNPNCMA